MIDTKWKMTPREITPEMRDRGWELIRGNLRPDEIWKYLWDAAPTPASAPVAEDVRALQAILDGYSFEVETGPALGTGESFAFISVENPKFQPDDGSSPNFVIDVRALIARLHPQEPEPARAEPDAEVQRAKQSAKNFLQMQSHELLARVQRNPEQFAIHVHDICRALLQRLSAPPPKAEQVEREPVAGERDWPEDFSHENGNYQCQCCMCGNTFSGHKRRVVCKLCARPAPDETQVEAVARASDFTAEEYCDLYRSISDAMEQETRLRALLSNSVNVILGALADASHFICAQVAAPPSPDVVAALREDGE